MRKIAVLAVAAAIACSALVPAFAGDTVTSTITAIDTKHRAVILADKTVMLIDDEVDLTAISVGMKVEISAIVDEDGYSRATAITPVN